MSLFVVLRGLLLPRRYIIGFLVFKYNPFYVNIMEERSIMSRPPAALFVLKNSAKDLLS